VVLESQRRHTSGGDARLIVGERDTTGAMQALMSNGAQAALNEGADVQVMGIADSLRMSR